MINKFENIEEINSLFELIKTMFITGLSQTETKRYLKEYTHSEIKNGTYEDGVFIAPDLINLD